MSKPHAELPSAEELRAFQAAQQKLAEENKRSALTQTSTRMKTFGANRVIHGEITDEEREALMREGEEEARLKKEALAEAESRLTAASGVAVEVVEDVPALEVKLQGAKLHKVEAAYQFKLIPLDQIDEPRIRVRYQHDESEVKEAYDKLREHGKGDLLAGQEIPILVHQKEDGRYEVIEGLTRIFAFRLDGRQTHIKAFIREKLTEAEAFEVSFRANEDRQSMCPYDKGMAIAKAIEVGLFANQVDAVRKLGISKGGASDLVRFADLAESVHAIIATAKSKFGSHHAPALLAIQRESSISNAEYAAQKCIDGWTREKLAAYVTKVTKPKESSRKGKATIIPVGKDGGFVKFNGKSTQVEIPELSQIPNEVASQLIARLAEAAKLIREEAASYRDAQTGDGESPAESGNGE